MTEEQFVILTNSLKVKDYHLIIEKNILNRLLKEIGNYLDIFFHAFSLSNRIYISHEEKMKKIRPCFSLILEPDQKFKNKHKFTDLIKKHQNIRDIIFKIKKRRKKMLSEVNIINKLFYKKATKGKIEPTLTENIEYKPNEEKIYSMSNKLLEIKRPKSKYKKIIRDLFTSRLNDFRKDIVEYCLENTRYLRKDNFENFVCFIEFFSLLFLGVKTKYYLDELNCLNMDFYADEKNIMNLAESFHYQVQFRIKDIPYVTPIGKKKKNLNSDFEDLEENLKIKKEKLLYLNMQKVSSINQENVEFYPTHCDFSRKISVGFRRYDLNDDYHICLYCENIPNSNKCKYLNCSSCFRQIDKERLITLNLSHIMNFSIIKSFCKEKYYENEDVFLDMIIIPNYEGLINRINNMELLINYLFPFETKKLLLIIKTFKDIYGESIGFFFVWISHYLKWLFYPTLFGLIMSFLLFIVQDNNNNKNVVLVINLFFIAFIILWGNYYYLSWEGQEEFYSYIWGMNDYKLLKNSMWDYESNKNIDVEIIMGVKMPIEIPFKYFIIKLLLYLLILFLHAIMIISNILIISTKSHIFVLRFKRIELFLNRYWKYIVPVLCLVLREIFSKISEKWNKWVISQMKKITKEQKRDIMVLMQAFFEFFNYYFNLYYIAFIKHYYGTCIDNDCHSELGDQLIIIIISDMVFKIIRFLIPAIYNIKQKNNLESKIKDIDYKENYSNKFRYYTRKKFKHKDMKIFYLKVILYFGYIMQFGASAPLSFLLILVDATINRIVLAFSLKIVYFAQVFEESTGLNEMKKGIKIISYVGILSNLCCVFYTNNYFDSLSNGSKLIYIALTENFVLIIVKLFNYNSLPKWFYYKNKIDLTYLRKFGIREKKIAF